MWPPPGRARSTAPAPLLDGGPASEPERALLAAAHLALGDARTAEHLIEEGAGQDRNQDRKQDSGNVTAPAAPLPALLYARALPVAADLPDTRVTQLLGGGLRRNLARPGPAPGRRWPDRRCWR